MTDEPRKKALLVEDNMIIRKVAGTIVEQAGYAVDYAINGKEAVDKCGMTQYDVVLMDMFMPVMNGDEATLRIRQIPPPAGRVPIIAVTATDGDEGRQRLQVAGVNGFLMKPFTLAQLQEALAGL